MASNSQLVSNMSAGIPLSFNSIPPFVDLSQDDYAVPVTPAPRRSFGDEGYQPYAKHWAFTLYPTQGDTQPSDEIAGCVEDALKEAGGVAAYVFQLECCPDTGRFHYQGHIVCRGRMRRNQVKRCFRGAFDRAEETVHVEPARDAKASIGYAQKDTSRVDGPWKGGDVTLVAVGAAVQGKRSDILAVMEMAMDGKSEDDIMDAFPTVYFHHAHKIRNIIARTQAKNRAKLVDTGGGEPTVTIYWGKSGVGKTRRIYQKHGAMAVYAPLVQDRTIWWEGYNGQKVLLLDDFDPESMKLPLLLKLCDRYAVQLPVKGGSMTANFEYIYFTSNKDPMTWYHWDNPAVEAAFVRRITGGTHHMQ